MTLMHPAPSDPEPSSIALLISPLPSSENPVLVYIASLSSEHSRRMMRRHLDTVAHILTNDEEYSC